MKNEQKLMWEEDYLAEINLTAEEMVKILSINGFGKEEEVVELMKDEDFSYSYYIEEKQDSRKRNNEYLADDYEIDNYKDYRIVLCVNGQLEQIDYLTIVDGEEDEEIENFIDTYYGL